MAQSTYERLQALAIRELGERLVTVQVGYGASESILICMVRAA